MEARSHVPRWVLWFVGLVVAGWLLYALRGVLAPVFFAFLIAYILDPVVDRIEAIPFLQRTSIGRGVGIGVLLLLFFALTGAILLLVLPLMLQQISDFLESLPGAIERAWVRWEPVVADYGLTLPHSIGEFLEDLHLDAQEIVAKGYAPVTASLGWLLGGTASALGAIVAAITVPVFAFYLTYDFDNIVERVALLIPPRRRDAAHSFFGEIDRVLGQFFRGQFTVMAVLAVLYSLGYGVIGVPLALPIGIMAGLLSFIPYVGSFTALGAALLMTALDGQGWRQALWVAGVHFIIQGLEGFVITPKIMGGTVGLSAIAILFALLVGGELLGFTGVLLAVPTAAVIKILLGRIVDQYESSDFFRGPS